MMRRATCSELLFCRPGGLDIRQVRAFFYVMPLLLLRTVQPLARLCGGPS